MASMECLRRELRRMAADLAAMRAQVALTPTLLGDAEGDRATSAPVPANRTSGGDTHG